MRQYPLAGLTILTLDYHRHGMTSVHSAHPVVIEAALRCAATLGRAVLVEANWNVGVPSGRRHGENGCKETHSRAFADLAQSTAEGAPRSSASW
jgi:tagatose-1,6-bisphosphate aldolase non-catalytic subunit AgaZ/GatZ